MPFPQNMAEHMFTCRVCNRWRFSRQRVLTLEGDSCCAVCVTNADGPGAHESARGDDQSLATLLLLESWSMDSGEDDFMHNEGWGYCARFGQYLYYHDSQGARSYEDCGTAEKAEQEFQRYYLAGWGADESDAYVYCDRWYRGFQATFDGKELDIWAPRHTDEITERRALARVRLEMIRTGYYPDVWIVSERGDIRHASL
jgi:hypothetical protein